MPLDRKSFEEGVVAYAREIARRSAQEQAREQKFAQLAAKYAERQPPHFTPSELELIVAWKHTDARWRAKALMGLRKAQESLLVGLTSNIGQIDLYQLDERFRGKIEGVGVATVSAIITAACPDLFSVIDDFALRAIRHHYDPGWLRSVPRDKKTQSFNPDYKNYVPYVEFCRDRADELASVTGQQWTPRRVEMALWAIGKELAGGQGKHGRCVAEPNTVSRGGWL